MPTKNVVSKMPTTLSNKIISKLFNHRKDQLTNATYKNCHNIKMQYYTTISTLKN